MSITNIDNLESKQEDDEPQDTVEFIDQQSPSPSEELYKSIVGEEITFNSSSKLYLDLLNPAKLKMMTKFGETKTQLPNLRRVWIDKLNDSEAPSIEEFLTHSIPNTLPILVLNNRNDEIMKLSLIKDGLVSSVANVTDQVWMHYMELKSEEVEEIIKASSQAKELIFAKCKLSTERGMDLNCNGMLLRR